MNERQVDKTGEALPSMNKSKSGEITKIERTAHQKKHYDLYIDDEYALSIHEDVLIRNRLLKGETVDADQLLTILSEQEQQKVYSYAIKLLALRLWSAEELLSRFKEKGFDAAAGALVIERLGREGYLNDQLFAHQLTQQRIHSQKKGKRWIKQELKAKGVDAAHIDEALGLIDEETEYEMALKLALKRFKPQLEWEGQQKEKRRIAGMLLRRGYSERVTKRVLQQLCQESLHTIEGDNSPTP